MSSIPEPRFDHLLALSGPLGTFEHAEGTRPRIEHGLCVDDVARVVVVLARERELTGELAGLAARSRRFLTAAVEPDGRVSNRCSASGHWRRHPVVEDAWGRAVLAAGTVYAAARSAEERVWGDAMVHRLLRQRSAFLRSTAYAALGAAEVLDADPGRADAVALLIDAVTVLDRPEVSDAWRWIEPRLAYANAIVADALVAAGLALGDDTLVRSGIRKLTWLVEAETRGDHFSVTPVGGRGPGDRAPGFDQQPLELAALATACRRAHAVTGDRAWLDGVVRAAGWFAGDNDLGRAVYDPLTGGGHDGLTATGVNVNQGAESTVSALETLQHARQCVAMAR